MGVGPSESVNNNPLQETSEMFEINSDNGYFLCNKYFIPEEVLALILSHVPPKDLVFNCRRVCKYWCNIIDSLVWRIKLKRINVPPNKIIELPWFACFWIVTKQPLGRNLIRNSCGEEELQFWNVLSCGGDGWKIEKPPLGCEPLPKDEEFPKNTTDILKHNSCFATSYYSCSKNQIIDLKKEGLYPEIMNKLQPKITIGDWCCGRFDCSSIYELKVKLLNSKAETVADFEIRKKLGLEDGTDWEKISHVFVDYGHGVEFIEFYHGGMDSQFWKGHYGSKMTGAVVTISL